MITTVELKLESPNQPEIVRMLDHADAFYRSLYPEESNHLADVARLCRPDVAFYIARINHVACGFGALFDFDAYSEVKRMYVDPPARGQGIGQEILHRLETHAREKGVNVLRLETGVRQPEAIALYRQNGFNETAEFGDYPADPLSIFFEKKLA